MITRAQELEPFLLLLCCNINDLHGPRVDNRQGLLGRWPQRVPWPVCLQRLVLALQVRWKRWQYVDNTAKDITGHVD